MAVAGPRPYGAFRFDVTVARRRLACSAVVLPRLTIGVAATHAATGDAADLRQLVLRRGYTGTLELYEWWDAERSPKRTRGRRVVVGLLDERGVTVTEWRFEGCRPVALDYSPLDAASSSIVTESITLSFESEAVG